MFLLCVAVGGDGAIIGWDHVYLVGFHFLYDDASACGEHAATGDGVVGDLADADSSAWAEDRFAASGFSHERAVV